MRKEIQFSLRILNSKRFGIKKLPCKVCKDAMIELSLRLFMPYFVPYFYFELKG